jgi:tungstate transport system permease protein
MNEITTGIAQAFGMIFGLDAGLLEIVWLSLKVSLSAVALAALIGLPLGALLAITRFPGRTAIVILLNGLMGLPPVVVGLFVYLLLSRAGPFGVLGLLFTPTAMIIAQTILITPIIAAVSRQIIRDMWALYREQLLSFGARPVQQAQTLVWDGRAALATAVLAGFGRATAEVGAVMIVGGNIEHSTRVLTTAIALETSKGDLPLAIGLGIVLIVISICVNAGVFLLRGETRIEGAGP